MLSLIVAHDENRLIGIHGDLPWRLPNDLKHFKALSVGKIVLMGRKTWDSLPRRPLPDRENWVLSRDPGYAAAGARMFSDLAAAIAAAQGRELVVIGGAALYEAALPQVQTLHLTEVLSGLPPGLEGGVYFPQYRPESFALLAAEAHQPDQRHALPYCFKTLQRR